MYGKFEVALRENIVTPVFCPVYMTKFTVRLHWSYLIAHKSEEIKVICLNCVKA
jgi:hypothetical protein